MGPVHIDYSQVRGRGLFVSRDVRAGDFLLSAQALVTGDNDKLPWKLLDCTRKKSNLRKAVMSLSRGTQESESQMPRASLVQLVAPHGVSDECEEEEEEEKVEQDAVLSEVESVLHFNQFCLTRVNPNAAPIEVATDTTRSGLWLLPAFLNHSCLINVQRVIVGDVLFLRAARDLVSGEELFECYIEVLQPLLRRREALKSYGIVCGCWRCRLEEAALSEAHVHNVFDLALQVKELCALLYFFSLGDGY